MATTFTISIEIDPRPGAEEVIVKNDGNEVLRWNVRGAGNAEAEILRALKELGEKSF